MITSILGFLLLLLRDRPGRRAPLPAVRPGGAQSTTLLDRLGDRALSADRSGGDRPRPSAMAPRARGTAAAPVWEATTGGTVEASSPVVVVIHGWGHSHTHSIELVEAVIEAARDHGDSSRAWSSPTSGGTGTPPRPDYPGGTRARRPRGDHRDVRVPRPGVPGRPQPGGGAGDPDRGTPARSGMGRARASPYRRVTTPVAATLSARGLPGGRLAGPAARLSTPPRCSRRTPPPKRDGMTQPLEVLVGSEDRICPRRTPGRSRTGTDLAARGGRGSGAWRTAPGGGTGPGRGTGTTAPTRPDRTD